MIQVAVTCSLRTKLGSALELLRLYQHKLQALESLQSQPACQAMRPDPTSSQQSTDLRSDSRDGCAAAATQASSIQGEEELALTCGHPPCRHCNLPKEEYLPAQQEKLVRTPPRQMGLRFDPSIGASGAFVAASGLQPQAPTLAHHTRGESQIVGTPQRAQRLPPESSAAPASSAEDELSHAAKCGRSWKHATSASESDEGASEDPWAFMTTTPQGWPLHAARRFDGDLLSLVTDVEDMMSCSENSACSVLRQGCSRAL